MAILNTSGRTAFTYRCNSCKFTFRKRLDDKSKAVCPRCGSDQLSTSKEVVTK